MDWFKFIIINGGVNSRPYYFLDSRNQRTWYEMEQTVSKELKTAIMIIDVANYNQRPSSSMEVTKYFSEHYYPVLSFVPSQEENKESGGISLPLSMLNLPNELSDKDIQNLELLKNLIEFKFDPRNIMTARSILMNLNQAPSMLQDISKNDNMREEVILEIKRAIENNRLVNQFNNLPDEIKLQIISNLDVNSIISLSQTNKNYNKFIYDPDILQRKAKELNIKYPIHDELGNIKPPSEQWKSIVDEYDSFNTYRLDFFVHNNTLKEVCRKELGLDNFEETIFPYVIRHGDKVYKIYLHFYRSWSGGRENNLYHGPLRRYSSYNAYMDILRGSEYDLQSNTENTSKTLFLDSDVDSGSIQVNDIYKKYEKDYFPPNFFSVHNWSHEEGWSWIQIKKMIEITFINYIGDIPKIEFWKEVREKEAKKKAKYEKEQAHIAELEKVTIVICVYANNTILPLKFTGNNVLGDILHKLNESTKNNYQTLKVTYSSVDLELFTQETNGEYKDAKILAFLQHIVRGEIFKMYNVPIFIAE